MLDSKRKKGIRTNDSEMLFTKKQGKLLCLFNKFIHLIKFNDFSKKFNGER